MKKQLAVIIFLLLIFNTAFADQKNIFADALRNGIRIIDNAWWNNNNLSVSIDILDNETWSGADTYNFAERICSSLSKQGFKPISLYTVDMIEVKGQSKLLSLNCK